MQMEGYLIRTDSGEILTVSSTLTYIAGNGAVIFDGERAKAEGSAPIAEIRSFHGNFYFIVCNEDADCRINEKRLSCRSGSWIANSDRICVEGIEYIFRVEAMGSDCRASAYDRRVYMESGGRRMIAADYEVKALLDYQRSIIEHIQPDYLLSMDFMTMEKKLRVFYDCDGLLPLSIMMDFGSLNIYRVLFNLSVSLMKLEDHLIQSSCILIDPDYIYVDPLTFEIKLYFVPDGSGTADMQEGLKNVVVWFGNQSLCASCAESLENLKRHLEYKNQGLENFSRILLDEERAYTLAERLARRDSGVDAAVYAGKGSAIKKEKIKNPFFNGGSISTDRRQIMLAAQLVPLSLCIYLIANGRMEIMDKFIYFILISCADYWMIRSFGCK